MGDFVVLWALAMLTRLRVSGFKNLINVDVRFGPFTCVTGANGVGKSNLFDAIRFLSALADRPLTDAALSVRNAGVRNAEIHSLFHHVGGEYTDRMTFEVEMIVPEEAVDTLGQTATASTTFLRYALDLAYLPDERSGGFGKLEILREELDHINIGEATRHLLFPHRPVWRRSVIKGRRAAPLISTEQDGDHYRIVLHQDGSGAGPTTYVARYLPRTILSGATVSATPTALLARKEMQSWRTLQLEPSALRQPDEATAPTQITSNGAHLPATLHRIALQRARQANAPEAEGTAQVYLRITDRLSSLIEQVRSVWIEQDFRREVLTLYVTDQNGTDYPARSLSDGTLRFLALAALAEDPEAGGLLCVEEPENGIHTDRIPAMVTLLKDLSTNPFEPVGPDNPLRQIIINTHASSVLGEIAESCLLIAELKPITEIDSGSKHVVFGCVRENWRQKAPEAVHTVSREALMDRLGLVLPDLPSLEEALEKVLSEKETAPPREPAPQLSLFGEA